MARAVLKAFNKPAGVIVLSARKEEET